MLFQITESEYREILNLGIPLAMRLNRYLVSSITHGQAVALGMVAESMLALTLKHISSDGFDQIAN